MNIEQHVKLPTIDAIFAGYEKRRKNAHRPHLGGSQIGQECERALWYQFRWMATPKIDGRTLRLFETGDREEERLIDNLRSVGVRVFARDPHNGRQFTRQECGGHFGFSADGIGEGFEESSKPHLLEFKTMNQKAFDDINKHGLKKSKPIYWAQVHVGMYLLGLERAYFFAVNKNTDAIYGERVPLDKPFAESLIEKARRIVFAEQPPAKLSEDQAWYQCKWCSYADVCHRQQLPEINCRTCAHSTPRQTGGWHCERYDVSLDDGQQRQGCEAHIYNPYAMHWPVHDASRDWVDYVIDGKVVRNEASKMKNPA